jgi:protein-tyrosine phosphatase
MREIVKNSVWIGNAGDARDIAGLYQREIQAVVDLAIDEPARTYPREIIACRFPIIDGDGNSLALLQTALLSLTSLVTSSIPTLIHCSGGMSRSPAFAAVSLSRAKGSTPEEWLRQIASTGPVDVSPTLWNELLQVDVME